MPANGSISIVAQPISVVGYGPFTTTFTAPAGYLIISVNWSTSGGQDGATIAGMVSTSLDPTCTIATVVWTCRGGNGPYGPVSSGTLLYACITIH